MREIMIHAVKAQLSKQINKIKIMTNKEDLMAPLEYTPRSVCLCDWSGKSKSKFGCSVFDWVGQREFELSVSKADGQSVCWPVKTGVDSPVSQVLGRTDSQKILPLTRRMFNIKQPEPHTGRRLWALAEQSNVIRGDCAIFQSVSTPQPERKHVMNMKCRLTGLEVSTVRVET